MKEQVQELIEKLQNHEDVIVYNKYESESPSFNYYYSLTGKYKGDYFMIYLFKLVGNSPDYEISPNVTDESSKLHTFLKTLTLLKFKIT